MAPFSILPAARLRHVIPLGLLLSAGACFPGGVMEKGGFIDEIHIEAEATRTLDAPYRIACRDRAEILRREGLVERGETPPAEPPVRYVPSTEYTGGCEVDGETSRFFLFHLWPVTPPLDPAYALGLPVQELEGDTMIHIRAWHETHYYSLLGHARVFHVRGDVIRFDRTDKK